MTKITGNIWVPLFFIIILFLVFYKPGQVFAVDITFVNAPVSISDEPFTVTVTITDAQAGTNYLRIDLFKESTSSYFGETYNGSNWYLGSEYNQYLPINISSGTPWSGDIQGKIGSTTVENGQYKLRIRRYTSQSYYTTSGSVDVIISMPTPTTAPTETPTPTSLPTATPLPMSPTETPTPITTPVENPTITTTSTPTPVPISHDNIYISEVMVYPNSGENEWVEIYNNNDLILELQNWYIDDQENAGSSPKIFTLELLPKAYMTLELTSNMFNNDADHVRLMDSNKNIKDSFEYSTISKGKTYGRVSFFSDAFCLQEPSKGMINNSCLNPTATPTATPTNTPTTTPTPIKTPTPTIALTTIVAAIITPKDQDKLNAQIFRKSILNTPSNDFFQEEGQVLSEQTYKVNYSINNLALLKSFSFASFSLSVLTIISVLSKMLTIKL